MLVSASGREGKFAFLCGAYEFAAVVNGSPIFKSRKMVPANYGSIAGLEVFLHFNELALAWVLSVELGTMDVLAFCFGSASDVHSLQGPWYIKSSDGFLVDSSFQVYAGEPRAQRKVSFRDARLAEVTRYERDSMADDSLSLNESTTEPAPEASQKPTSIKLHKPGMSDVDREIVASDHVPSIKLQPMPAPQRTMPTQSASSPPGRPSSKDNQDWTWLLGPTKVYRDDDLAAVKYTSERVGKHLAVKKAAAGNATSSTGGKRDASPAKAPSNAANAKATKDIRQQMLSNMRAGKKAPLAHVPGIDLEISDDEPDPDRDA